MHILSETMSCELSFFQSHGSEDLNMLNMNTLCFIVNVTEKPRL